MKKFVYLICDPENNVYKIGVTRNSITERIKELQTGNATPLHITAYHETEYPFCVERMLHSRFGHKKILNEWFSLSLEETCKFNKYCIDCENNIIAMKDNPFFKKYLK